MVIGGVLPSDRFAVLAVVHQGEDAIGRDVCRGVDAECRVVGGAPDDFFAPVA